MNLHLILCVAAMCLFGIAAWKEGSLIAAGLFLLTVAEALSGGVPHL